MKSRAFFFTLLSTIAIGITASLPAQAQRARVFVSVNGNDSNPCTALSPCRNFQAAHDAVQAGGEVDVLDTGGYGTLLITKSISIVNPGGVVASIATASQQTAITITVGVSDTVSLRGLTLDGASVGANGIAFGGGGTLEIADCVVRKYLSDGIIFNPNAASVLKVTNSEFNDNGNAGIDIAPHTAASVLGTLDHVGFYNNQIDGLDLFNTSSTAAINVTVKDSVASNNGEPNFGAGLIAQSPGTAPTHLIVVRSVISNNAGFGIFSDGSGAHVIVDESTIFNNAHAWGASTPAFIFTHGNNSVEDNAADFGPQIPAAPLE